MSEFSESVKDEIFFKKRTSPLWQGPEIDGITQSLIGRYLVCQDRFRVRTIEGLAPREGFNVRIEYGNMWHHCEECHASGMNKFEIQDSLALYCQDLANRFPNDVREVNKWWNVCGTQYPIYRRYWSKHDPDKHRTFIHQEIELDTYLELPSGRRVRIRGKIDNVTKEKMHRNKIYVGEHKSKGDVNEAMMYRQLKFDLQTMTYHTAAVHGDPPVVDEEIAGVRYNVVRRPLAGGIGSIKPHKEKRYKTKTIPAETLEHYYQRLATVIEDNADKFFMRWITDVYPEDITRFSQQSLIPILENMCDDYEWWEWAFNNEENVYDYRIRDKEFPHHRLRHYRLPYGIYNPITEGRIGDTDSYLDTGNKVGLDLIENLFPELSNESA